MTEVSTIASLFVDTIKLNDIDLIAARKVLLWMGIEFMRKEGFETSEIFHELFMMRDALEQLRAEK